MRFMQFRARDAYALHLSKMEKVLLHLLSSQSISIVDFMCSLIARIERNVEPLKLGITRQLIAWSQNKLLLESDQKMSFVLQLVQFFWLLWTSSRTFACGYNTGHLGSFSIPWLNPKTKILKYWLNECYQWWVYGSNYTRVGESYRDDQHWFRLNGLSAWIEQGARGLVRP